MAGENGKKQLHFMQQLWGEVQKIGQEMVLLADKLSDLSQNIYQKRW
jgi:hypothetical protein